MERTGQWTRRRAMHGIGSAAGATAMSPLFLSCAAAQDSVAVTRFVRSGDQDDSNAFRRAFESGRAVTVPAAGGQGPGGAYLVSGVTVPAGLRLTGEGMARSVIAQAPGSAGFIFFCDSGSPRLADNVSDIAFADLTLQHDVVRLGFLEYAYLVMFNGVSRVTFDRVGFRGFRGDGLHLGSSTTLHVERHNSDVTVRDCVFDGINANNRNAISIIDCQRLVVERSRFLNCTRSGDGTLGSGDPMNPRTGLVMPGPIDLEPNDDRFAIIRDITIRDNHFEGGGGYAVCLNLRANDAVAAPQRRITITGNRIVGRHGAFTSSGYGGSAAASPSALSYDVRIADNVVSRCDRPFILNGLRGVTIERNQFVDSTAHSELGNSAANGEVTLAGNDFVRQGAEASGFALWIREVDRLAIRRNRFIDCGLRERREGVAIGIVGGPIGALELSDNLFASPASRTTDALRVYGDIRLDRGRVKLAGNRIEFPARPLDQALGVAPAR